VNGLRPRREAACRLLARNVTATTYQLARGMVDARPGEVIRGLMAERQRLLAELARHVNVSVGAGSLAALRAAVAESDRTLEQMIG
jgi:hypothetical protein